ncbi:MAG: NADH-dependent peroxiredoxin subunit [Clostridiales bacterium]|nr:NADH-dependent peroxiredoxin subunit [Clostridiales bacterium]
MLEYEIKNQLAEYLLYLENDVIITLSVGDDKASLEMKAFVQEVASLSDKITVREASLLRTPSFSIHAPKEEMRVIFAAIPFGHEFSSFVLALLQVSGRAPKEDAHLVEQAKAITGTYHFETYVSLSCQICPDVVQAFNLLSILNPNISHTTIDGTLFQKEVEEKNIRNVPSVYLDGSSFSNGSISFADLVTKLSGVNDASHYDTLPTFDMLVIGGGPAGTSAAIYAARKGIRTGILVEQFGGQLRDTLGIENFISVKYIEGAELSKDLEAHVRSYNVDVIKSKRATGIQKKDDLITVTLDNGATIKSKTIVIATGARWRHVNVPGEDTFQTKGVAYCPHCDGPLYKDKEVAVIGGGNSGIEAAIDLAGIAKKVTVLEFLPELKADAVLQKRLNTLPNVTILTNVQTKEITGDTKVDGITYQNRETSTVNHLSLDGVFVQIGLAPNTAWLGNTLELNKAGEIIVDSKNATSIPGVFAAGDCTNSPYKQIIISMGSGATAALSAFDYLIRYT